MYKTEPHLHIAGISPCGHIGADEMVKLYAKANYDTVFISDHFRQRFFDDHSHFSWNEAMSKFLSGYETAKRAGEKYGVTVLLSAEIQFNDSPNHYLLYGVDECFLSQRKDIFNMKICDFYKYAKSNGVFVVQAHPYRDGICWPVTDIDAVEVHNSNPRHQNYTDKTLLFAQKHNFPITAGSDAHRYEDVALSGVLSSRKIESAEDYVNLILSGELEIIR